MLEHDFRSSVGYWVHITAHRFECAMNAELADEGITYRQCQVLAWLALEGELSQVDLARYMNVRPATIVKVLDRMERDGLITRRACSDDRRRHSIKPTKQAIPVWKRIVKCADKVRKAAEQSLSAQEAVQLRSLLARVHDGLASESLAWMAPPKEQS